VTDTRLRLLTRHFFNGFFDVEIIHPTAESHLTVGHILAVLAAPGVMGGFGLLGKYLHIPTAALDQWADAVWRDKSFLLFYASSMIGFVTVFQWDTLFPSRRDYVVFGQLPLRTGYILLAKVQALAAFLGLFTLAVNGITMVIFPLAANPPDASLGSAIWFFVSHWISILAASAFLFLFLLFLQGAIMNLLPPHLFRRVSSIIQITSLVGLVLMLFTLPSSERLLTLSRPTQHWFVYSMPPMWFLGLSEFLRGSPAPAFRHLASLAVFGFFAVLILAAGVYLLSYFRHIRRSLETAVEPIISPSWVSRLVTGALNRLWLRHPLERAVFYFIVKTAFRSRRHWLIWGGYAAVGFSLVLNVLLALLVRRGYTALAHPTPQLLAIPLVVTFLLLAGLRFAFTIPAELRANWVFRITESAAHHAYAAATRKAFFVIGILPVLVPLLPVHAFLWGWTVALHHFLFCAILNWILIEIVLRRFHKIPFACSYLPGKANLPFTAGLYISGFLTYVTSIPAIESGLFRNPSRWIVFYGVAAAIVAYLAIRRRKVFQGDLRFSFEEIPEPAVMTLNLRT